MHKKNYIIVKDRHPRISEVLNDCISLCVPASKGEPLSCILQKICAKLTSTISDVTTLETSLETIQDSLVTLQEQVDGQAPSYLVYTAFLSQTGTNVPVATVLENTLGGTVVWTRNGIGDYMGTLAGAFTVNKTLVLPTNSPVAQLGVWGTAPFSHGYLTQRLDINTVNISINKTSDGSPAEMSDFFADNQLFIEIRVYL